MSKPLIRTVELDREGQEKLERRLAVAISKLEPGSTRSVLSTAGKMEIKVPKRIELEEIRDEILASYSKGVKIASNAESTCLIRLFKDANLELPIDIKVAHEQMKYEFYLEDITFSIILPKGQHPMSAEFSLRISDDISDTKRQTRPIRLFPSRKDIDLFRIDLEGGLGVDTNLSLSPIMLGGQPYPFAKISADANFKAKFAMGPLKFFFRKAAIEVRGENDRDVYWRYNLASELSYKNDFKSYLLLKVPNEAKTVGIAGTLSVVPFKRRWALLKDVLPPLTDSRELQIELVPSGAR
jgi:hypothetical protein